MLKFLNYSFETGKKTYLMGILNVTTDSFFDGGKYNSQESALSHYMDMLNEGADIIDIGAQSTRPGHKHLTSDEELNIIKEYLPYLYDKKKAPISVDTFYPQVAEYAVNNGACIINDVSGVFNPEMAEIVRKYKCGWVITHTAGSDSSHPLKYKDGIIPAVNEFFDEMKEKCVNADISLNQLIFDPGIGFGKDCNDDSIILKNFELLNKDIPLLLACSSKRVIGYLTGAELEDRLYGTIAANLLASEKGADFIRVHNVKENKLALKLADALLRS